MGGIGADAQTAYSAVHGTAAIQPWRYGFFSADLTEAKFGLTFMKPLEFGCDEPGCVSDQIDLSLYIAAAGRKGQRDLLSKVDFVPGFDVGGGLSYVSPGGDGGYNLVFLRGTWSSQERKFAITNVIDSTTTIGQTTENRYAVAVGFNHAFSNVSVIGLALEGRRELSSPGAQRPIEVCGPGSSQGGFNVVVCNDRYTGPLPDLWTGQARLDANLALAKLGAEANSIHFGVAAGGSVDFTEGATTETNVAVGPTLNLPEYPGQPVLSLLFGMMNLSDVNLTPVQADDSFLNRHFLVRLAFSIPFRVMAGTS